MLEDVYPLSPLQEGLYYHWLNDPASQAYFSQMSSTVEGVLNIPLLKESYSQLVNRYAILRSFFTHALGEEPLQVVRTDLPLLFEYTDVSTASDFSLVDYKMADRKKGFNLRSGSQMRLMVLKTAENKFEFIWSHHHILMDGWCVRILVKEFFEIYSGLLQKRRAALRKVYPYSDYIKWLGKTDRQASIQYWNDYLSSFQGMTGIPVMASRNSHPVQQNNKRQIIIDGTVRLAIKQACSSMNITENIFFQTIWAILLGKYNNTSDVVFGAVVSGRPPELEGVEDMVGLFINTIPVRIRIDGIQSFAGLLKEVQLDFIRSTSHHAVQLADIQSVAHGGQKLFDHIFVFENYPEQEPSKAADQDHTGAATPSISFTSFEVFEQTSYDLWLAVIPGEALSIRIHYNAGVYQEWQLDGIERHLVQLIEAVAKWPGIAISSLDILTPEEKSQLLFEFNDTAAPYAKDKTITELFEEQVARTPDATAIADGETIITFHELNSSANTFGNYLKRHYHIRRDDLVGIKLPRSIDMITAILAVLKAGGAYLPLEPAYPQSRIDYIINDSNCRLVIDEAEVEKYQAEAGSYPAENLPAGSTSTDLLYVIYTSGSTGNPKGCMIEQRGIINRLEWMWNKFGFSPSDVILQKTNFTFDVSVPEIFGPLCIGAKMVLCPADTVASPERLASLVAKNGITCMHFVPSMMTGFIELLSQSKEIHAQLQSLRAVMVSGEALSLQTVSSWYEQTSIPIHNLYGPTEASVEVSWYDALPGDTIIPIGRPIWNTRIYIYGEGNTLAAVGTPGEICIGGVGLARGYLNNPALTAEKFIADPFNEGERIYRTGDIGRWLPDAQIEYLGRKDDQVKIRGFRIEPGEVCKALEQHPDINAATITVREHTDNDKELVAYIISRVALDAAELRGFLRKTLPEYMLPAQYVQLEKFPLTISGKIDRKQLPAPDTITTYGGNRYVAPRNDTEEKLVQIWQEILGKTGISVKDDFLSHGGHSIKAMRLSARIRKVFNVRLEMKDLLGSPVLEAQAQLISRATTNAFVAIRPLEEQSSYLLSSSQLRIWILSQFDGGNLAYVMNGGYAFEASPDFEALTYAFNLLIERHEILRTVFRQDMSGEVRQFIQAPMAFEIGYLDLRKHPEDSIAEHVRTALAEPFDLAKGPLLKAVLVHTEKNKWILTYFMHHIISDGWSVGILIKELLHIYNARVNNKQVLLTPLRIQYKDYAAWEQDQLKADTLKPHKEWWLNQFSGELPVLDLPQDNPRPAEKTYQGGVIRQFIPVTTVNRIKQLNDESGTTLFMSLLAFMNILFHRYANQEDIIIGTVVTGREHIDLEDQIGFYLRTLALRTRFNGTDTYRQLLSNVRTVALGAFEHHIYPFEELVDELRLPRDRSRHPLIDVMLVLHDTDGRNAPGDREEVRVSKFDLLFEFAETTEGILLELGYNSDIYNSASVERLALHLAGLIESAVLAPEMPINRLAYLSDEERHLLLQTFNDNTTPDISDNTVIDLFERQVCQTPLSVAVRCKDLELTYEALDRQSSNLAAKLQSLGIGKGSLVPVCMERSADMLTSVLGILKTGAAYVPIDPEYPEERINYIVADCNAGVIVCSTATANSLNAIADIHIVQVQKEWISVDSPVAVRTAIRPSPGDLAYIIYTSGSTGTPKGVMIEHAGMLNHLLAKIEDLHIGEDSVIAYTAAFTFDISVWQMLAALLKGGQTIVYADELIYQPAALMQAIDKSGVTILELVPSYLTVALETLTTLMLDRLKLLLVTGEAVSRSLLEKWFRHIALSRIPVVNAYGPTEASDDICHHFMYDTPLRTNVPVGKPIRNTNIYILNTAAQLCPVGVAGEICVAGKGVGRGYLGLSALTAEKFIEDPFGNGTYKMYKTGDLGRWLADGTIEYLGRLDEQVKIHGYRIEPGEIANVMKECAFVSEAVVLALETDDGDKRLTGYVVPAGAWNREAIVAHLRSRLPEYMIPGQLIPLEQLPLTVNGKLDKKALPVPEAWSGTHHDTYVAPRTETEQKLVLIWQEVLGREKIGITDNFFEAGGHSLKAIQMITRINTMFQVKITIQGIFREATIEGIAGQIDFLQEQQVQRQVKKDLIQIEI